MLKSQGYHCPPSAQPGITALFQVFTSIDHTYVSDLHPDHAIRIENPQKTPAFQLQGEIELTLRKLYQPVLS